MGIKAVLLAVACAAAHATSTEALLTAGADDSRQHAAHEAFSATRALRAGEAIVEAVEDWSENPRHARKLLHGCHSKRKGRCKDVLPKCPRCSFPSRRSVVGHCKKTINKKPLMFNCTRRTGTKGSGTPLSIADSVIGSAQCPAIHAVGWPGHFDEPPNTEEYSGDYYLSPGESPGEAPWEADVLDYFTYEDYTPQFVAVATPDEFQEALRVGAKHILIENHLNMTASTPVPDKPREVEALDNAIGRLSNTTLTIVGWCDDPPPSSFGLKESVKKGSGVCAILVKEDFLDAPLGTTCLLLDSLYVVAAEPGTGNSSVLVLHVDGLMWIMNCYFQGAGPRSRAIDTNTINGGTPELYIKDTKFNSFSRNIAPGIRLLANSRLWLDNVDFANMARLNYRGKDLQPDGAAIAAWPGSAIVMWVCTLPMPLSYRMLGRCSLQVIVENATVLGEPAGDRGITVHADTEVYSTPVVELGKWPGNGTITAFPDGSIASYLISTIARPQLQLMLDIQAEIILKEYLTNPR